LTSLSSRVYREIGADNRLERKPQGRPKAAASASVARPTVRRAPGRPLRLVGPPQAAGGRQGDPHPRRHRDRPGCNTVFCQMAAEVWHPFEDVIQGPSDSDTAILDSGMFSDAAPSGTAMPPSRLRTTLSGSSPRSRTGTQMDPKELEFKKGNITSRVTLRRA